MSESFHVTPELGPRKSLAFNDYLRKTWELHTGKRKIQFPSYNDDWPDVYYSPYDEIDSLLHIGLEEVHRLGLVAATSIFDSEGRISQESSLNDWFEFASVKPLRGARVAVIGGPEGRVFAEWGADVCSVDPYLDQLPLPHHLLTNAVDFPDYLTDELVGRLGQFDITMSSAVFDVGSGIWSGVQAMEKVLKLTKHGGVSIHNGGMMRLLVEQFKKTTNLRKIIPLFEDTNLSSMSAYYVLEKIG